MKANEAPEKFYYAPYGDIRKDHPITDNDIEYIMKDAFIEKACVWLRTHSEADYFELIPDANYCGAGNLNKKRMIDEFRNYMERE